MNKEIKERIYNIVREAVINGDTTPSVLTIAKKARTYNKQVKPCIDALVAEGRIEFHVRQGGRVFRIPGVDGETVTVKEQREVTWTDEKLTEWNTGHLKLYRRYLNKLARARAA